MSLLSLYNCGAAPMKKKKLDYNRAFQYWHALLSNKVLNLFKWDGLPFEEHELEVKTQFLNNGYSGIVRSKRYNRIIAASGSGVGVTEYPDKWITFVWACPGDFGEDTIGTDAVIVRNNFSLQPTRWLVERYAHLLAHAELSLQAILINSRSTGILAARDQKQRDDIALFYQALEDGKTLAIVDDTGLDSLVGSEGLRQISTAFPSSTHIMDFWQIRQNLYKEFLTEIGISKSTDKRERVIQSEVAQDLPLFGYSLDDMLLCRKEAAEEMNRVFGLNVSVSINPIIESIRKEVLSDGNNSGSV